MLPVLWRRLRAGGPLKLTSPTRATLLVVSLFVLGAGSGMVTGRVAAAKAQDPYASLDLFAKVLTVIETDYVDEIPTEDLVEAAIEGMTGELDPHSRWLSAEEARSFQEETKGHYEGIGVEVRLVEDGVLVSRVLPGGPAERDGVHAGDILLEVDGEPLTGLNLDQVAKVLQGPRGDKVLLTLLRGSQRVQVSTVRDRVHVEAVEGALLEGGIAYLHLDQFTDACAAELKDKLARMERRSRPLSGIILDLRDNPGGLLSEAVSVSDLFLDAGPIVSTRGRIDERTEHMATRGGVDASLPVAVLINGGSASASEIVAGALQDTGRATLVGSTTYGKGSVQSLYRHEDGSALKLTVARYYTPSGLPVATRHGREPDVAVALPSEMPSVQRLRERLDQVELPEAQRIELIELVNALPQQTESEGDVPWHLEPSARLAADAQLQAAVEVIREQSP